MVKNYQLGKIYKMESPSGLIYVGSTCEPTLARRLAGHKRNYKQWIKNNQKYITSFKLFEESEDNVNILLLENYPCNSSDELTAREGHYIKLLNCVNKRIEGRTQKEYISDNIDKIYKYHNEWINRNGDYFKEYYDNRKEHMIKKQMEYNKNNADTIREYQKNYQKNYREQQKLKKPSN
jgi:hypothetical protein